MIMQTLEIFKNVYLQYFPDKIQFDPVLPSSRKELIKRMPAGDLTKVIVTYKEVRGSEYRNPLTSCKIQISLY